MARIDYINEMIDRQMAVHHVPNTTENRIAFLNVLYAAWLETEEVEWTVEDALCRASITVEIWRLICEANPVKKDDPLF